VPLNLKAALCCFEFTVALVILVSGAALPASAFPAESTATHREVDGHETPLKPFPASTSLSAHLGEAAAGLVEVTALPLPSPAAQNDEEGHEMASR